MKVPESYLITYEANPGQECSSNLQADTFAIELRKNTTPNQVWPDLAFFKQLQFMAEELWDRNFVM